MNILFIFGIISSVILILVSLLMTRRVRPGFRSYFVWAAFFFLLPLIANVLAMVVGLGYQGGRAPHSFHPFVIFIDIFFFPSGLILGLMGLWDSQANPDQASLHH